MKALLPLLTCAALLLTGCAVEQTTTPSGRRSTGGRLGTDTALRARGEGPAATLMASAFAQALGVIPPDWHSGPDVPAPKPLGNATFADGSYFELTIAENNSKSFGNAILGAVTYGLGNLWAGVQKSEHALSATGMKQATKRTGIAAKKEVALKGLEIEAAEAAAVIPVNPVPVVTPVTP